MKKTGIRKSILVSFFSSFCLLFLERKSKSRHFACKLCAAENVEVEVGHGLASVCAAVGNNAVAVGDACRFCDGGYFRKDVSHDVCVSFVYFVYASDMRFGYNEDMNGCLRCDIVESEYFFVFIRFFRGDNSVYYFAKKHREKKSASNNAEQSE